MVWEMRFTNTGVKLGRLALRLSPRNFHCLNLTPKVSLSQNLVLLANPQES